jgi:DNA (cytosine-5)-methyltransferase 3A
MKILSLFDGISCARVALERVGINVKEYYASEVDKYAIAISKKNYPDIIQVGSVAELVAHTEPFDLLIGGSPCQDLSIAKKDRKGLDGERSGLFWEYVRILKENEPKYFILENVASMPKEAKDLITKTLGVEPIMINASLVSAQNRKRLFWTNIPNITLPKDRGILLKDILEKSVDKSFDVSEKCITGVLKSNYRDRKPMNLNGKANTLKLGGDVKRIVEDNGRWRYLTPNEYCRLQGLPDEYTNAGVSKTRQYFGVGNAFNVDVVAHILSFIK